VSIRHVVVWTLKDPADASRFKAMLDACAGLVPGMLEFEVGIRHDGFEASADVVLVARFADTDALAAYHAHPRHVAISSQLTPLRTQRHVIDYPIPEPHHGTETPRP
jgi:quinol monooxygenase YgiN